MKVSEWVEICGLDGLEKLSRHLGGRRVYIPSNKACGTLRKHLSEEAAEQLASRFAGSRIMIPERQAVINYASYRLKTKQIRSLIYDGLPGRTIARIVGVSDTYVRKIRRSMEAQPG